MEKSQRADVLEITEGSIDEVRRDAVPPACLVDRPGSKTGACTHRGRRETWEVPSSPSEEWSRRNRRASASERGGEAGSRSAAVGAMTRGNQPEGPRRAKGGTGPWNRSRAR